MGVTQDCPVSGSSQNTVLRSWSFLAGSQGHRGRRRGPGGTRGPPGLPTGALEGPPTCPRTTLLPLASVTCLPSHAVPVETPATETQLPTHSDPRTASLHVSCAGVWSPLPGNHCWFSGAMMVKVLGGRGHGARAWGPRCQSLPAAPPTAHQGSRHPGHQAGVTAQAPGTTAAPSLHPRHRLAGSRT